MPATTVETLWTKFGNCHDFALVGRDAIAMVSGVYVRFYEPKNGKTRVERFDGGERGDGACCLAGLSLVPIFAVAERKSNPRITIFAYPTMKRISRCAESQKACAYLYCTFAGTEYLLGQTTFPDFRLVVWYWRTGEQLTAINGSNTAAFDIHCTRITCSVDSSHLVAQFTQSTGTLSVYRILACSKVVRLFPIDASTSFAPVSCCWSTEGILLCCDEHGTIWSIDFEEPEERNRVQMIIEKCSDEDQQRRNRLLIAHNGGILVINVSSTTRSNFDIKATFYRKVWKEKKCKWQPSWTTPLPSFPRHAQSDPREDRIVIFGENGELFEILDTTHDHPPRIEVLQRTETSYRAIAPLHGPYFGTLDQTNRLAILDAITGNLVSQTIRLSHHGEVVDVTSHPALPIFASCSITGNCLLVETTTTSCLKVTSCVHIQQEALDRVKFSEGGRLFGVGASDLGRLFLLLPIIAKPCTILTARVIACLNLRRKVIDFLIYETDNNHMAKTLVLVGNSESSDRRVGNEIVVYSCGSLNQENLYENGDHSIKLSSSFESLYYGRKTCSEMVGVPYLTKQLHRIELKVNFQEASLSETLPSLHQTRGIVINVYGVKPQDSSCLLTCGFDGLIILRDCNDLRRVFALFVAHHRADGGSKLAILANDIIVSLGRNGDLVANKLPYRVVRHGDSRSTSFADWITRECFEQVDATETENGCGTETWMDATLRKRSMAEERQALASRLSILNDWDRLKRQLKEVLDLNQTMPPDNRLPVSAFDLDQEARERKLIAARQKEDLLIREAEERIRRQNLSSRYLYDQFLNPLLVRPRSIFSLFGESKVTNYPLVKLTEREMSFLTGNRSSMETEVVFRLENEEHPQTIRLENAQTSRHDFEEVLEACITTERCERELKEAFNERFERMRTSKIMEIKAANKRANEIRRLVLELKDTFNVDASSNLLETPRWHPTEIIEDEFDGNVDSEAREQLNKSVESVTESDIDEFHREALERMMDGVLEVRLEDSAKRNVLKPECLVQKDPSNYTKEDIQAIDLYEKKLQAHLADREKYKSMLETEIERINREFSNAIKAFNDELDELSTEKLQVERLTLSQRLLRAQTILRYRKIVQERRNIERIVELELVPATKRMHSLAEECDLFETGIAKLRNRYESACKQNKLLEGQFRAEFVELKPPVWEYLLRQFRRRPRVLTATYSTSVTLLEELASCVVNRRTSEILPREGLNYLRAMDNLDAMPDGLSSRLESNHWHDLCRLRRLKVDAETKVKSCAIEMAEAEQSLTFLRNACSIARSTVNQHKEAIERMETSLADLANDRETTLTLKTGQLQIRAKGCPRSDWRDAVLVPQEELDRVNRAIAKAEQQKSVAQRRLAHIQGIVSFEEWRHTVAKAKMEDLQERLKELDRVKVSRIALECCQLPNCTSKEEDARIQNANHAQYRVLQGTIEREKSTLRRISMETRNWRRRDAELTEKIHRSKTERDDLLMAARDPARLRVAAFRRRKVRAIRRKACLARQIRTSLEQLSILKCRLEISKLKTYPTLRLRF
ncbi:unnamed protein product [Xylocopa violacea]|uniref:Cilia- and flagella-associated protein 43 n=1 Tax=Xylocopa violacea TaxID=135666 RepID=A0ABP1NBJ3_XYLVO